MKKQKNKNTNFIFRRWGTKPYIVTGSILALLSLVFFLIQGVPFVRIIVSSLSVEGHLRWDYFLPLLGIIALLTIGILYLLIGMVKFKINRLSNISIKLTVFSLFLMAIIPILFLLVTRLARLDFWLMDIAIFLVVLVMIESLILVVSLILLLISILKK